MKKISQSLLYIDMFGFTPRMEIKNKVRYKTFFGTIISLFSLCLIIIIIAFSSIELFEKSHPNVLTTIYKDENPTRLKLNQQNFMMTLGITFGADNYVIDESIYRVEANQITMIRPGNGDYFKFTKKLDIVKCSEVEITILPNYFQREDLQNLFCFKNLDTYIQGEYGQQEYTWIEFNFIKCIEKNHKQFSSNYEENKKECQTQKEIENKLKGAYMSVYMIDRSVIESQLENPIEVFGINFYNLMTIKSYKEMNLYFKKIEVITDRGYLYINEKFDDSFSFDRSTDLWDYRDIEEKFFALNFRVSNIREVYRRSYLKLHNIMSDVGGFIKLIMLIGEFIVHYYSELSFKDYITQFFLCNHFEDDRKNNANINEANSNFFNDTSNNLGNINYSNISHSYENNFEDNYLSYKSYEKIDNLNYNSKKRSEDEGIYVYRSLSFLEKFYNIICFSCCKSKKLKRKIKNIEKSMDKIKSKLDWVNLIKFQNEYEALKSFFLNKQQNEILSLNFNNFENIIKENLFKYKYNLLKFPKDNLDHLRISYKNVKSKEDKISKSILNLLDDKMRNLLE